MQRKQSIISEFLTGKQSDNAKGREVSRAVTLRVFWGICQYFTVSADRTANLNVLAFGPGSGHNWVVQGNKISQVLSVVESW